MALEAELIFAAASRGISWTEAQDMELWQLAAALGLHRVETRADHDARVIVEEKREYFEQTGEARLARVKARNERRRQGSRKS